MQPMVTPDGTGAVDALMAASKIMTAVVARSLAGIDPSVTVPQLRVLVMIGSRGPMNLSAVAEGLGVNPSNASRTCDRLVVASLLSRREDRGDRRNVVLTLTARGSALVDELMRERRNTLAQVVSRMSGADQRQLAGGLGAFVEAVNEVSTTVEGLGDDEGRLLVWLS